MLPAGDASGHVPLSTVSVLTQLTQLSLDCTCSAHQLHSLCSSLTRLQYLALGSSAAASHTILCAASTAVFGCCSMHSRSISNLQWKAPCSNAGATAGPDGLFALGRLSSSLQHLTLKDGAITAAGTTAERLAATEAAGMAVGQAAGVGLLPALAGAGVLCCSLPLLPQLSRLTSLCLLPADGCGAMISR
jgi:hypothetical protein